MENSHGNAQKTGLSLESIIIICELLDTPVILPDLHDCASRAINHVRGHRTSGR